MVPTREPIPLGIQKQEFLTQVPRLWHVSHRFADGRPICRGALRLSQGSLKDRIQRGLTVPGAPGEAVRFALGCAGEIASKSVSHAFEEGTRSVETF